METSPDQSPTEAGRVYNESCRSGSIHERGERRMPNRRRALTACRLCRSRKTRCDNARPTCDYCAFQGLECIYEDKFVGTRPHRTLPSQTSVSNDVLLDRIIHLTSLVEDLQDYAKSNRNCQKSQSSNRCLQEQPVSQSLYHEDADVAIGSAFTDDGFGQLELPQLAIIANSCGPLLQWPILQEIQPRVEITSFPLQPIIEDETHHVPTATASLMREEDFLPLCKKFLVLIHVKNPVLDVPEFKRYARRASEHGPSWDAGGCIVLLTCALACLATPYDPNESAPDCSRGSNGLDKQLGDAYFNAARKRLGLLPNSLLGFACQYFAGLYEKFAIRPFSAWLHFQQACVRFQAYLGSTGHASKQSSESRSIFLGEHAALLIGAFLSELRAELQLPTSGLLKFKYPEFFSSLSFPSASNNTEFSNGWIGSIGQSPASQDGNLGNSERGLEPEEERSWLYYLAEISLRGLMNKILRGLYGKGQEAWLSNINDVLSQRMVCSQELELWREHLPHQIRFDDANVPQNEFALFLQTRYLCCIEWLSRPFLFYVVHQRSTRDITPQLITLAQQCVHVCWEQSIGVAIRTIRDWEEGAPDLKFMGDFLESFLASTRHNAGERSHGPY
ncbi:hypothetical protein NUW58_g1989 [Xylaria curta]|uniref:Uncharacterized protein n=1 Tax=Xylaria curta TaxID=42375 RepID=A0ACC1PKZ2_9PEZI|nr:hypothetical protein NUW58_g1989 [Xylaria curta]